MKKEVYKVREYHRDLGFGYQLDASDDNEGKVTIDLNELKDLEVLAEEQNRPDTLIVDTYYTYVNDEILILGYTEV